MADPQFEIYGQLPPEPIDSLIDAILDTTLCPRCENIIPAHSRYVIDRDGQPATFCDTCGHELLVGHVSIGRSISKT